MSTVPVPFDLLNYDPLPDPDRIPLGSALYPERASWGMGTRHVSPYFRASLEGWFNRSVGDDYNIFVGNLNIPLVRSAVSALANRYFWTTPGENVPRGEVQMFAELRRVGSGQVSRSAIDTYLIKTDVPGGLDPIAGNTWHDGLSMSIQGKPQNSVITPAVAAAGMTALINKYANIRTNDLITLSVGGRNVFYTVSPTDAAGPGPIPVYIPPEYLPPDHSIRRGKHQLHRH